MHPLCSLGVLPYSLDVRWFAGTCSHYFFVWQMSNLLTLSVSVAKRVFEDFHTWLQRNVFIEGESLCQRPVDFGSKQKWRGYFLQQCGQRIFRCRDCHGTYAPGESDAAVSMCSWSEQLTTGLMRCCLQQKT